MDANAHYFSCNCIICNKIIIRYPDEKKICVKCSNKRKPRPSMLLKNTFV